MALRIPRKISDLLDDRTPTERLSSLGIWYGTQSQFDALDSSFKKTYPDWATSGVGYFEFHIFVGPVYVVVTAVEVDMGLAAALPDVNLIAASTQAVTAMSATMGISTGVSETYRRLLSQPSVADMALGVVAPPEVATVPLNTETVATASIQLDLAALVPDVFATRVVTSVSIDSGLQTFIPNVLSTTVISTSPADLAITGVATGLTVTFIGMVTVESLTADMAIIANAPDLKATAIVAGVSASLPLETNITGMLVNVIPVPEVLESFSVAPTGWTQVDCTGDYLSDYSPNGGVNNLGDGCWVIQAGRYDEDLMEYYAGTAGVQHTVTCPPGILTWKAKGLTGDQLAVYLNGSLVRTDIMTSNYRDYQLEIPQNPTLKFVVSASTAGAGPTVYLDDFGYYAGSWINNVPTATLTITLGTPDVTVRSFVVTGDTVSMALTANSAAGVAKSLHVVPVTSVSMSPATYAPGLNVEVNGDVTDFENATLNGWTPEYDGAFNITIPTGSISTDTAKSGTHSYRQVPGMSDDSESQWSAPMFLRKTIVGPKTITFWFYSSDSSAVGLTYVDDNDFLGAPIGNTAITASNTWTKTAAVSIPAGSHSVTIGASSSIGTASYVDYIVVA